MVEIATTTARPPREQQAWDEIGVTTFSPGVKWFLILGFLFVIVFLPIYQHLLTPQGFAALKGLNGGVGTLQTGSRVHGVIRTITAGPERNGVYSDFVMKLHLQEVRPLDPGAPQLPHEAIVLVQAMRDRVMQPAASLKPGDRVILIATPWVEVAETYGGLMASEFQGSFQDQALLLPQFWAEALEREGAVQLPEPLAFYGVWSGEGAVLPPESRKPVWHGAIDAMQNAHGLLNRLLAANTHLAQRTSLYEHALDDDFILTLAAKSEVQEALIRLGVGNEKAYIGREGWLFYEPGVRSLTGPGFLEPEQLRSRARSGNGFSAAIQPDPRIAILEFKAQLAARGIELILMPTPIKPTIHPEKFSARFQGFTLPLRNRSFDRLLQELRDAGVMVYDPAAGLKREALAAPQYLATDTHWRPEAMQRCAVELAKLISEQSSIQTAAAGYRSIAVNAAQIGDLGTMLELPTGQQVIRPETVTLRKIMNTSGNAWSPQPKAKVLLLGDSFTNIYSLDSMGWGSSAGFAEQLAFELQIPLNRISRNDAGAYATRERLRENLQSDPHFLDGCKVLIWQFAERELAVGDWRRIQLGQPPVRDHVSTTVTQPDTKTAPPTVTLEQALKTSSVPPIPLLPPTPPHEEQSPVASKAGLSAHEALKRLGEIGREALAKDQSAIAGKDGWLFLASELRHLGAGPYWGDAATKASQAASSPDPLAAILDLHTKLQELGIRLILMPVPARAAVYPDKLLDGVSLDETGIPQRIDLNDRAFIEELRKAKVEAIDLLPDFLAARKDDATQGAICCEQDSHWSPRGIALAARRLSEAIGKPDWWSTAPAVRTYLVDEELSYNGDIVALVPGTPGGTSLRHGRVSTQRDSFEPLADNPESPVLVLADSHGLVFHSGGDMHAQGAGLSDRLAHLLGISIDLMARRGSGSSVRMELARRFLSNPAVAPNKRILVYCFAMRYLTESESWKPFPLRK